MALTNAVDKNIQQEVAKQKTPSNTSKFDGKSWGLINRQHWDYLNNPSTHKSLDFSNVNIYGENNLGDYKAGDPYDMRRFHQMVIYTRYGENSTIITSNLPERVQYSLNSTWQEPLAFGNALTNLLFQAQSGLKSSEKPGKEGLVPSIASGINRAATIRIWNGTQPLSMQVTIPVLDDNQNGSGTNLVEALDELGKLALPSYDPDENNGWYSPPPNPLTGTITFDKAWATRNESDKNQAATIQISTKNHKRIMIQLGGILLIDSCVIESVSVDYPDTKTMIQHDYQKVPTKLIDKSSNNKFLHPLLANVTIKFSTVEAMTTQRYSDMLWARRQSANLGVDFRSGIANEVDGESQTVTSSTDTSVDNNING